LKVQAGRNVYSLERDIPQVFNFTPSDLVYGAVIVESNITSIVGNVSYLDPKGQFKFRAALPLASEAAQDFALDQVNIRVPRSLRGRGEVDLVLTVEGKMANPVRINVR
jgi:hypothetical protein